jgi:lipopolysaccharide export system permease protein
MDRYLLREYLFPLFYCLVGFSMIYVICDLLGHVSRFIAANPPMALAVKYYLCKLTPTLDHIIPASLLFATLYTLWQFTRRNELTAMRASGISLYRAVLPILGVGLVFSALTAVLKETVSPKANQWAMSFKEGGFQEPESKVYSNCLYYNSRGARMWVIDRIDMGPPVRLTGVAVRQERPDGTKAYELTADRVEWLDRQWWVYHGAMQKFRSGEGRDGDPEPLPPVEAMRDFNETPADLVNEVKTWEFLSPREMRRYLKMHPKLSSRDKARKKVDVYGHRAVPWACLIVTLFGIPTGAGSRRQSALVGIFIAMACFFAFYGLQFAGIFFAKRAFIQPWLGAWLSNIVFLCAGVYMTFTMR